MADPTLPVDMAEIVALFLGALWYGIFLVSFAVCLRCLVWRTGKPTSHSSSLWKPRNSIQWNMLAVTVAFFLLITIHISIVLSNACDAFARYKGPGGAIKAYAILTDSSWTYLGQSICLIMTICLADGILIYRCWVVWARSWKPIIFPIIMWAGVITMAIVKTWVQATTPSKLLLRKMRPYIIAFLALPIAQNLLTTFLIVYKIHQVDRESRGYSPNGRYPRTPLQRIMRIIIESGMLYTATLIITLVTYMKKSNAYFIVNIMNDPIVGTAFNLIIIRASVEGSKDEYTIHASGRSHTTVALDTAMGSEGVMTQMQFKEGITPTSSAAFNESTV